ncbi:uncharacterized protein EV154DRAFT_151166 [Mucor mucedo]|uniref:uncharacterized protein n=1 Tax=Mucor mucedo TaxID=29922 RepID=UPI00221ED42F|nr:uncharacterized protein EV154DRAFT_151166 [Mucor mucedo]KAI7893404.1 hypothetical protein EV154DRAFT_151166 [Mucor mucedo]
MHLLNSKLWIIRVFAAFLNHHQAHVNQRVAVKTIAKIAATGVVQHRSFENVNITTIIPVFEELYNAILIIYEDEFAGQNYDNTSVSCRSVSVMRTGCPKRGVFFLPRPILSCIHATPDPRLCTDYLKSHLIKINKMKTKMEQIILYLLR